MHYITSQVRDGDSSESPLLGKFCGSSLPENVTSSGNTLWMRFKSDSSVQGDGFVAYFAGTAGT